VPRTHEGHPEAHGRGQGVALGSDAPSRPVSVKEDPQLRLSLSVRKLGDDMEGQPPLVRGNTRAAMAATHESGAL
jgi:hypothetical protein